MAQRIFIKVVGFSDEERHLLNTVFRLSEQCRTMYQLWTPAASEPARAALLDGQSWEARVEAESLLRPEIRLLWVGAQAPAHVWRAFARPVQWGEGIAGLDALFSPDSAADDAAAAKLESLMSRKQALIVSADREERLYLRARLALARLTLADEAASAVEALACARRKQYDLVLIDRRLVKAEPWALVRRLRGGPRPVRHLALTRGARTPADLVRARVAGALLLEDPPDPDRLDAWLSRIEVGSGA
jgi:CheY-like chemotaxis protein